MVKNRKKKCLFAFLNEQILKLIDNYKKDFKNITGVPVQSTRRLSLPCL